MEPRKMAEQSPSRKAEFAFRKASDLAYSALLHMKDADDDTGRAVYDVAASLFAISKELGDMSVGLRATYMMLNRVEQKLDRQRAGASR
jgi:hypothetical protein